MTRRSERPLGLLKAGELDLLLVTSLLNVRYLTGYTGSNGLALIGPHTRVFVTDFRYLEQAAVEVDSSYDRQRAELELFDALSDLLPAGELRVGFDDASVTVRQYERLRELMPSRVALIGAGGLVERLRAVKEPDEVARIRASSELADQAFEQLLEAGLVGRTEREVALALEVAMRELGAQRPSFETIVAAGPHGALPHATPRDVRIEADQLVVIDWGAELDGYCSDCTRTVATGEPDERAREVYALVRAAQLAGLEALRAGAAGRDVDGVARGVVEDGGHGQDFGHGLGHGVGIEVHEAPRLSARSEDELASGNVVTVEPGVYLPGGLGVRIEDLVVVTESGGEILTSLDKGLLVTG